MTSLLAIMTLLGYISADFGESAVAVHAWHPHRQEAAEGPGVQLNASNHGAIRQGHCWHLRACMPYSCCDLNCTSFNSLLYVLQHGYALRSMFSMASVTLAVYCGKCSWYY